VPPSSLPETIGPYLVEGVLGAGGAGDVFKARDPQGGGLLAVKVLRLGQGADEPQRRRFARERRALAQLRHPGVVEVLDAGEDGGVPWLAMRLVEGEPLQARLRRLGPLAPDAAVQLGRELCAAMGAAHAAGILHRDLKPDNVLLAPGGRAVITDFGLAKELEVEASLKLSKTGLLQGTPRYWAPEQAAGQGGEATEATDVYGLGATLYAALTGVPPVDGATWMEILVATRERPPRPPSELSPGVPGWLDAVVLRCLEKAPADRFPSAAALDAALSRGGAPSAEGTTSGPRRAALWIALGVAAGVAAGVLAALAVTTSQPSDEGDPAANPSRAEAAPSRPPASAPEPAPEAQPADPSPAPSAPERAEELFDRAAALQEQGRDAEAAAAFRAAADRGSAPAMHRLAECLSEGRGVALDTAKAVAWLRRAADLDNADAMNALGLLLLAGQGIPQDEAAAARWFRRAAELGNPAHEQPGHLPHRRSWSAQGRG
jgi:hypothetical protein